MTMLSVMAQWLRPASPPDHAVIAGLNRIASLVGTALAGEPGFERKLAPRVRSALDYCEQLVAGLPQPLAIDRAAFSAEPHIHALFGSADDIDAMIGQSRALREHVAAGLGAGSEYCFALLAARRQEKSVLGVAREGDLIRNDVPQRLLHFSNHNISLIADEADEARVKLREAAFDGLIKAFAAHVHGLRDEQESLRQERALTSTRSRMAARRTNGAGDEARYTRNIASLDERLGQNANALLPGHQIEALADFLASPQDVLRLETVSLDVDRSGRIVKAGGGQTEQCMTLELTELISRDRRRHVVIPVRFQRITALQALDRVSEDRARFIVI